MIDVALRILADAGRALSARKILQTGELDALFDDVPTLTDLKAALKAAAEDGSELRQVRRGVYAINDGTEAAKPAPKPAPKRAPKPKAKPKAEAEADDDAGDEKPRRRRRQKTSDLVGDAPATALSVEEAVADAEASEDAASLRASIWKKMRTRVAQVAGVPLSDAPAKTKAAPRRSGLRGQIADTLKAKLAAEDAAWTPPPAAEPIELLTPADRLIEGDAKADLKARLAARWKANPLEAVEIPRTQAKAPKATKAPKKAEEKPKAAKKAEKIEKKAEKKAEKIEKKAEKKAAVRTTKKPASIAPPARVSEPSEAPAARVSEPSEAPQAAAPSAPATPAAEIAQALSAATTAPSTAPDLGHQAYDALLDADVPLNTEALAERLSVTAGAISAAVLSANASAAANNRRTPFAISIDGRLGLTAWSLSRRYQELETRIQGALREQAELVRTDIIERVAALSDEGFERVLLILLDRQGFRDVQVLQRAGSTVAVLGRRDGERTIVIGHRTSAKLGAESVDAVRDSLEALRATAAIVVNIAGFSADARNTARRTEVSLVDGRALSRSLYTNGVGLVTHRPAMAYMDGAFFAGLAKA